jgi:RNA-directed DNA polymerase
MPDSCHSRGRSGDAITAKSQRFTLGDLLGSGRVRSVGRRTRGRRPRVQQKSEDRVVPEGGVTPVERAGSSPGGQGKAVPVEETAVQLRLPIATAENPKGATRRRTRDRLGAIRAGAPKAIGKTGTAASATMEEVAYRLTGALLKVASNKGAPGADGQTIEALLEQWPVVLPRLQADLLAGMYRPGGIRRVFIPKAGGGQRG